MGLGPVVGRRFLLLVHSGRLSGAPSRVVVEVVAHDKEGRTWTVASRSGDRARWYQDLQHTRQATIQVGRRFHAVTAHFLSAADGGEMLADRTAHRPLTVRAIHTLLGEETDSGAESSRVTDTQTRCVRLHESGPR
ncbi:nitroreductase family deazaflavin-dependent oxidoreductase [Streptomyces sp. NPDC051320]|uniref:nitroreductase family deazaflavin-dependent oxidoreductase n=1 Tax=Streptomyces sp. NPDC051320 TaxID=3154644 RepID=UPI0034383D43